MSEQAWRRCSSCKNDIAFDHVYWVCNVSTCNRKRTGLVFCTVSCWDAHLPLMRHRESWAIEERSPTRAAWEREQQAAASPPAGAAAPASARPEPKRDPRRIRVGEKREELPDDVPREILVVTSKLKKYVRARWGMNTSDAVMDVLSDRLRQLCDRAVRNAREAERKTLMDRDF